MRFCGSFHATVILACTSTILFWCYTNYSKTSIEIYHPVAKNATIPQVRNATIPNVKASVKLPQKRPVGRILVVRWAPTNVTKFVRVVSHRHGRLLPPKNISEKVTNLSQIDLGPYNFSKTHCLNKLDFENPPQMAIYTKVPKTATSSMKRVLRSLAKAKENFTVKVLAATATLNAHDTIARILDGPCPFILMSHLRFINYTEVGLQMPPFVSMVRSPYERSRSHFYYNPQNLGRNWTEKLIDSSMLNNSNSYRFQFIGYFTGYTYMEPGNIAHSSKALNRAIEIIEKYYLAIGLVEEWEKSFKLFERVLPDYFNDASNYLYETRNVNKKYDKEKPSEKIRTFYCSFYENDCNLYAYLKKKFYSQFSKVMSVSYEQGLPSIVPRA